MSNFEPVKTVIVGCGMIANKGYQPRCQAYPHKIELVGYYDQDVSRLSKVQFSCGGARSKWRWESLPIPRRCFE